MTEKTKEKENRETEEIVVNKYENYIFMDFWGDLISYFLIIVIVLGSLRIFYELDNILVLRKNANPNYNFPSYADLLPSLLYVLILIILHEIFKKLSINKIENYLSRRYFEEGEEELIEIYKHKVSSNIYKFIFFLSSTIFGFYVLKDQKFFPWSMFGKGDFSLLYEEGYPNFFFFEKPAYFDFYYNLNFSFALFDGWILLTNPLQSDFLIMLIHHLSTYSLIIFSFISNHSAVGSVIYYIFYLGDIFSYIVRVSIHLNVPEKYSFYSTLAFLIVFTYTRLFVYGDLLYQTVTKMDFEWSIMEQYLVSFLFILMVLNIMWIVLISRKFVKYCMTGNIEEIYKFKLNKNKVKKN
jgi:hypothetical protein